MTVEQRDTSPVLTLPAICHHCGAEKRGPLVPCKACGFTPTGEERPVAWLFSAHHLDTDELKEAARRIREGERPDPSRELRARAREAMGARPVVDIAVEPLGTARLLWLSLANLLLTPLAGYAVWYGLHEERPYAARQALRVTLPASIGFAILWVIVISGGLFR